MVDIREFVKCSVSRQLKQDFEDKKLITNEEKMARVKKVECMFNTKIKTYSDGKKSKWVCKIPVYKAAGFEDEFERKQIDKMFKSELLRQKWDEYREAHNIPKNLLSYAEYQFFKRFWLSSEFDNLDESSDCGSDESSFEVVDYSQKTIHRKKTAIFDYVYNNDWDYFVTLTVNYSEYGWTPAEYKQKVTYWLNNLRKRQNIEYLLVAEYHKNSERVHLHILVKGSAAALGLTPSGTYIFKHSRFNKPIKARTAINSGLDIKEGQEVFNVTKWKYGFSTAIKTDDNKYALAAYITKYITKDTEKIFGKSYWHSKGVLKPLVSYENSDFEAVEASYRAGDYYKFTTELRHTNNTTFLRKCQSV